MNDSIHDDDKHSLADHVSPQRADETSALGHMSEEPMDIDATEMAFTGHNDDNGPRELV